MIGGGWFLIRVLPGPPFGGIAFESVQLFVLLSHPARWGVTTVCQRFVLRRGSTRFEGGVDEYSAAVPPRCRNPEMTDRSGFRPIRLEIAGAALYLLNYTLPEHHGLNPPGN